jgi:5-methylcytosine-specific restriction endonuclease McrA
MSDKDDCYKLIQELCIKRDVFCQHPRCGEKATVGHHIFHRSNQCVAFDPENIIGLCYKHHTKWAHGKPKELLRHIAKLKGEKGFAELQQKAKGICQHLDYAAIKRQLRREIKKVRG